jgi:hypothetical protein
VGVELEANSISPAYVTEELTHAKTRIYCNSCNAGDWALAFVFGLGMPHAFGSQGCGFSPVFSAHPEVDEEYPPLIALFSRHELFP